MLHRWEEPSISGENGSGCVFFSGCALGCIFCQNYKISHGQFGKELSPEALAAVFCSLEQQGAHNLNLVNPTHYVQEIKEALLLAHPQIPVVYNCGGYESLESLKSLSGLVEIYLPDLKFTESAAAGRYANAPDYPTVAKAAIEEMYRQVGPVVYSEEGLFERGVMVRHLILPENVSAALDVIDWVAERFPPESVALSLMSQYTPVVDCERAPELCRPLSQVEHRRVLDYLDCSPITLGYTQEEPYSGREYIPEFDLSGL